MMVAMTRSTDPWTAISPEPDGKAHPDDLPYLVAHNRLTERPEHQLILEAMPQPWAGNIDEARVLIFGANPGWSADDAKWEGPMASLLRENLAGSRPMFWFEAEARESPGGTWIRQRLLADVLLAVQEEAVVAGALCLVDFHAYHSTKGQALPISLPTQAYTFDRVRERIAAGAAVVITRAVRQWKIAVPELLDHPYVYETNATMNTRISPKNIGRQGWEQLCGRLWAVYRIWFGG